MNGFNKKVAIENKLIGTADKELKQKARRKRDKMLEREVKFYLLQQVNKSEAMQVLNDIRMDLEK